MLDAELEVEAANLAEAAQRGAQIQAAQSGEDLDELWQETDSVESDGFQFEEAEPTESACDPQV